MADEKKSTEGQSAASDAWNEVGQQFKSLGESLASAFNATWHSEETREHLKGMQAGLEAMVDRISQITKEVSESGEAKKVQAEVEKAAQSAKVAGEETIEEIRPHLLSAFRKIRAELDQMISRMEQEPEATEGSSDENDSASDDG